MCGACWKPTVGSLELYVTLPKHGARSGHPTNTAQYDPTKNEKEMQVRPTDKLDELPLECIPLAPRSGGICDLSLSCGTEEIK